MASKAVVDAVKARLASEWSALPVFGPNERTGRPPNGSSFVDVEYPVAVSEVITTGAPGNNVHREEGMFRLIIAARRNTGVDEALTWAEELSAIFRAKYFDGVQTHSPNPPIMGMNNDDGLYYMVSVGVPYSFDLYG